MDTSQYLDIFLDESKEHLQTLSDQIMELEQNPENMDTINEIFRAAHSLKGMAGTMGYKRMQTLTHDMENVFSEVRNGTFKVKPGMVDILFKCLDALEDMSTIFSRLLMRVLTITKSLSMPLTVYLKITERL
jgi:two-component system chemotaxis sensor kinase CheA